MNRDLSEIGVDGEGAAIALRDPSEALTFDEMRDRIADGARMLRQHGVRPGDAVLLATRNCVSDLIDLLAILRIRGVAVPLRDADASSAVSEYARRTGARFMMTCGQAAVVGEHAEVGLDELNGAALVLFTSGSTGEPKGAILESTVFHGKLDAIASVVPFDIGMRTLVSLRMSFGFGIWVALLTLRSGGTVELADLSVADALQTLCARRVERWAVVPTMLRALLAKRSTAAICPLVKRLRCERSLHDIVTGGEVLGPAVHEAIAEIVPGVGIYDVFGLTETSTSDFILGPHARQDEVGSVGYPTPGVRFRLTTVDGSVVVDGEPGELEILTPFRMRGYLRRVDLTEKSFSEGYFRTGDVARRRANGALEILGRSKEIIVRGGVKISPVEVEHAVTAHPSVSNALAVGVSDPVLGESVWVGVVYCHGQHIEPDELRAFLLARVERHLVPDRIVALEELPAGPTGKSSRAQLRKRFERYAS